MTTANNDMNKERGEARPPLPHVKRQLPCSPSWAQSQQYTSAAQQLMALAHPKTRGAIETTTQIPAVPKPTIMDKHQ